MTIKKQKALKQEEKEAQKKYKSIEMAIDSAFDDVEKLKQEDLKQQTNNFRVNFC